MLTTSVFGDMCTHGARIISGSHSRSANGQPVARMGDMVDCPQHGPQPIVTVLGGMPMTDGMLTVHESAMAACGAIVLPSIVSNPTPVSGMTAAGIALMENDDTLDEGIRGGGGNSSHDEARSRAILGMSYDDEADPSSSDGAPNTRATPVGCKDIPDDAPDSLRLSPNFTLRDLSSGAACARAAGADSGPVRAQKGLSRSEIICNLRHLANNTLEPIAQKFGRRNMLITSGFRRGSGGSDHTIGSAVDIQFLANGRKVSGRELDRIQKVIINELKVPFTQIIHENNSWLHFACRRNGANSAKRICWWAGGKTYHSGYRY